jgi:flagellar hook-associated protein 1 FlgK
VTTKKANSVAEHQQSIVDQLKNIRESVSGVSLDEEAMKMIEHQKHFEASARLIKVADDMLTTVIGLVGR